MGVNRIIEVISNIVGLLFFPVQIVSTFVLGLIVTLTFGFFLIPISIIWLVLFFWPLLILSFLWERVVLLRIFVNILGVPLAVLANLYAQLMPSMGETESRVAKLIFSEMFPYNWSYFQYLKNNTRGYINNYRSLLVLFDKEKQDPLRRKYLLSIEPK